MTFTMEIRGVMVTAEASRNRENELYLKQVFLPDGVNAVRLMDSWVVGRIMGMARASEVDYDKQ